MNDKNSERDISGLFIDGKEFPKVPFQIVITNISYCKKYSLPIREAMIVTNMRYSIKTKEIRYSLLDTFFDFPWDDESCEPLILCSTN